MVEMTFKFMIYYFYSWILLLLYKMCLSVVQSLLLLKHVRYLIEDKTGLGRVMKTKVTATSVAVVTTKFLLFSA